MTDFGNTINRRQSLKHFGAAGVGSLALMNSTAHANIGRVTSSQFNYRFKTFGTNEEIKVGMIGTTSHTSIVLNDIPDLKNTRLVAYANYENDNVKIPKDVKIYKEYEEMLDKEQLDVVGISLPYYLNAKASAAAAERKIHIVTEKPVATTIEDLTTVLEATQKNKVRLTTMLNMRVDSKYLSIRNAIAAGDIGEPILATGQKSYRFGESRPEFYKKIETYGGTIPWIGIHTLDYIHFTTNLDFTEVTAAQGNKDHPDYPGFQDFACMLLRMSNGGSAVINLDYLRPETASSHGDDRLRVIGSEGVIEIKDGGSRVEIITSTKEAYDVQLPERIAFFADFIAELRGEGKHILSPEEPFEMTRVALLAHQSAEQNRKITL